MLPKAKGLIPEGIPNSIGSHRFGGGSFDDDRNLDPINDPYANLLNQFDLVMKERGIKLSELSKKLLRLSVRGWFEDPPDPEREEKEDKNTVILEREKIALKVFIQAMDDRHIIEEMETREEVSFWYLYNSLDQAAISVIGELGAGFFGRKPKKSVK